MSKYILMGVVMTYATKALAEGLAAEEPPIAALKSVPTGEVL